LSHKNERRPDKMASKQNKRGAVMGEIGKARALAGLRITMGLLFLYAGIEKLIGIGLGAGTNWTAAGFLKFGTAGTWPGAADGAVVNPFQGFWINLASNPDMMHFINFIVPWGELGIGIALVLGLFTRFATVMGVLMMALFYVASWDFSLGVVNSDLVYLIVLAYLGIAGAGEVYGLDREVEETEVVKHTPQLRYVLG
jgi:thiosulfate dehydrogenase (quinone) large subunit